MLGELRSLFEAALDAIRPENLPSLGTNLEGLVARAVGLLQGVWDFAGTVASEVLRLIKNALLGWLSEFAHELPGFELLTVILGRNPFTAEPVPRTAETLIRGFITLLPGGRAVYEELAQTGVVGEAASRIEGAMGELGISWEMVTGLFQSIWSGLSIHDLIDPVGAFTRIRDQFGEPIARLFAFVRIVIREMFSLVLALMNFPSDVVGRIIANAMQAYEDIRRDPIGFLINTLATVKAGFSRFFGAIFDHLLGGLIDWLFRGLRQAGIEPPSALTLETALDLVLQVLGITTTRLWEKLAERIGQERVDQIRGVMDRLEGLWDFVRDVHEGGLVKLWEYIEGQITDLWDVIIEQARSWIMETIVNRVVARLLSMLDPTGVMAVVNSFIAFFNAVQSAIEYVREILAIIDDYVATMAAVARGDVEPGAARLEQGLVSAIPVAIGFLANQVGLGNVGDKIEEIIGGLRAMVDRALDWLLDQAERLLDSLLRGLGVLGDEDDGSEDGEGAIREEFDLASQGHAIFIDASGRLMVASGDPQPVSGLAELRALHDEYRALPEDATTAARRRTIQKMITVIKAHPHLLLSTVEEGIGDPPNLGDIRPHRSQTPRYRPPSGLEAYAPLWELLSEHVIPRSFVDALFSAFRLEKPKVEESEYGAMRTILIYRGAASRKTEGDGGDNSVYQVLRETAAEIMAVVMGSSQPGLHFDVGKETVQNLFERYAENALDRTAEAVIEEHASGAEGHEKTKGELRGTPPRPTYGRLEEAFEAQAEDVVEMLGDRLR